MTFLSRKEIIERASTLAPLCSEFEFKISKPATPKQVAWRQKQVNRPIPNGLADFAMQCASRVLIHWELDPKKVGDVEFQKDVQGSGSFEFNFFGTDVSLLDGWEDSFVNWKEYRSEPNPFDYAAIFPLFAVGNGDLIVSLIEGSEAGAVYYLDHEGGDGDWKRLATSCEQFLDTLAKLWFPELDWSYSLELFYDEHQKVITAECILARQWDDFIRSGSGR
jgi:hypothetical protein